LLRGSADCVEMLPGRWFEAENVWKSIVAWVDRSIGDSHPQSIGRFEVMASNPCDTCIASLALALYGVGGIAAL